MNFTPKNKVAILLQLLKDKIWKLDFRIQNIADIKPKLIQTNKVKNKTNKTISKRVRTTKNGKLMRMAQSTQHLVSRKSQRQMKNAGKTACIKKGMAKKYIKLV